MTPLQVKGTFITQTPHVIFLIYYRNTVAGSPMLLHNTFVDEVDAFSPQPPLLHIRSSPFGSFAPAIPIARSITIARVASPISTNRQYQQLFTESLKSYFEGTKRLLKQGDLVAISIDTDLSRTVPEDVKLGNAPGDEDVQTFRWIYIWDQWISSSLISS